MAVEIGDDNKGGTADGADAKSVRTPFEVLIDTREQIPYTFKGLVSNAAQGNLPLIVPTRRITLPVGDYALFGLPKVVVERKSKGDLYTSVSQKRENFEMRLRRMCLDYAVAAVVVESDWDELLNDPPRHTRFAPKALYRTILAWMIRWPRVHWLCMPGREVAEATTFRFLEKFWEAYRDGKWFDHEVYFAGVENRPEDRPKPVDLESHLV